MNDRIYKGKSIIDFPKTYVVVDIETTGLSPKYCEIIEISALRIENDVITDKFSSLVKLPDRYGELDSFITKLTGITTEMLSSAPELKDTLLKFREFIADKTIVGHNVGFDINFLYDAFLEIFNVPLNNNFINTMRISKKLFPHLKHHRLDDIADMLNISRSVKHRALEDCITTNTCFISMRDIAQQKYQDLKIFYDLFKRKNKTKIHAKDLTSEYNVFDETHPLYKKNCAFTGKLDRMDRKEAMQAVLNLGGQVSDTVTKNTNFLILGCNDYCKSIKNGKSTKYKKAQENKLKGLDIEIIDEDIFYSMLEEKN